MKSVPRTLAVLSLFVFIAAFHGPCDVEKNCNDVDQLTYDYETVVIGDSKLAFYTGECENVASHLSRKLGMRVHSEAVSGARISSQWAIRHPLDKERPRPIEAQFETALAFIDEAQKDLDPRDRKRITTVILDGGGNEILSEGNNVCERKDSTDSECAGHLEIIGDDFLAFVEKAMSHGVKRVIYSGYQNFQHGKWANYNNAFMDLNKLMENNIVLKNQDPDIEVIFVDNKSSFMADDCVKTPECDPEESCYDHYMSHDKLHPSIYGTKRIAENIYEVLK